MLFIYGNYSVAWVVGGTGSPAPAATTSVAALSDGRSGAATAFIWGGGSQSTASYVQLTGTISDPLDATAPIGGVGVINVMGLPAGTLVDLQAGTYTQRLVAGRRGNLSAWILPTATLNNNTITIRIYNNVNGVASIAALTEFAIGEIIVGRLCSWPLLIAGNPPQEELMDPTQYERSDGGQLWQLMRKPFSQISGKLAYFNTVDAMGGPLSSRSSGANPAGKIDARSFMYLLAVAPVCAVCAVPHEQSPLPTTVTAGGFLFDVNMIQQNFMLARPTQLQPIAMDQPPFWSWGGIFQEAT